MDVKSDIRKEDGHLHLTVVAADLALSSVESQLDRRARVGFGQARCSPKSVA